MAGLGPLCDQMVFLGGCATGLLITDPAAPPVRVTRDVDVIVEVVSLNEYRRISASLRKLKFSEDRSQQAPICRWTGHGVLLDVMPTSSDILGFSGEWFERAFAGAEFYELPSGRHIRLISAPYFLLTKLTAFDWRVHGDFALSHDLEDFLAVINGWSEVIQEIEQLETDALVHLVGCVAALLANRNFVDSLPGHLPGDSGSQARLPILVVRLEKIAKA